MQILGQGLAQTIGSISLGAAEFEILRSSGKQGEPSHELQARKVRRSKADRYSARIKMSRPRRRVATLPIPLCPPTAYGTERK
jgi:hypothetical protein